MSYRALATEMLAAAFGDMRSVLPGALGTRVRATAWLVSSAATPWCEIAGVDQLYLLERGGWSAAAVSVWAEIRSASQRHLEKQGVLPHHIRLIREHLEPSAIVHVA